MQLLPVQHASPATLFDLQACERWPGDQVVSPSQIKLAETCERRWGFRHIGGLPDPSGAAAERGLRVHKLLEDWATLGVSPPSDTADGRIAHALLPFAPAPHTALAEGSFWFEMAGIRYRGLKDLVYPEGGTFVVHDWKVTSSFDWALSQEQLLSDPQALIYAVDAFTRQGAKRVTLRWVYATSGGKPRHRVVEVDVTAEGVAEAFKKYVHEPAMRLVQLRRSVSDPQTLKPNPLACSKFPPEGCPYRSRCNLTTLEKLEGLLNPMDASKLRERIEVTPDAAPGGPSPFTPQTQMFAQPLAFAPVPQAPPPAAVPVEHILRMADGQLVVQVSDRTYAPVSDAGNGQYYVSGEAFDPSVPRAPAAVTHAPTAVTQPPTQAPAATAPVAEPVRKARTKTAPADATPTDGAAKKGRPAGAKTRALSLEQQVYMSGVQATMANPVYGSVCNESTLQLSGQMALRAFQMQFGEE